jgi:hypothetical protein
MVAIQVRNCAARLISGEMRLKPERTNEADEVYAGDRKSRAGAAQKRPDRPASDFREMGSTVLPNNEQPFEKAASVKLDRSMSCGKAFRVIAGSCIRQVIANEPGMCARRSNRLR